MARNLTRRQIAGALAAAPLLAQAPDRVQAPAPKPDPAATNNLEGDPLEKAKAQIRRNAETLSRVQLEMAVEPSFAFKP